MVFARREKGFKTNFYNSINLKRFLKNLRTLFYITLPQFLNKNVSLLLILQTTSLNLIPNKYTTPKMNAFLSPTPNNNKPPPQRTIHPSHQPTPLSSFICRINRIQLQSPFPTTSPKPRSPKSNPLTRNLLPHRANRVVFRSRRFILVVVKSFIYREYRFTS